jgi:hypothetical protein
VDLTGVTHRLFMLAGETAEAFAVFRCEWARVVHGDAATRGTAPLSSSLQLVVSSELRCYRRGPSVAMMCEPPQQPRPATTTIGRTPHPGRTAIQHVRVDHRRADVRVAEKLLKGSDVVPILERVRR